MGKELCNMSLFGRRNKGMHVKATKLQPAQKSQEQVLVCAVG